MNRFFSGRRSSVYTVLSGLALLTAAVILGACSAKPIEGPAPAPAATPTVTPLPVPSAISGKVVDPNGPVAGAIVQVKGTPNRTTTDKDGAYTLQGQGLGSSKFTTVTAWSEGHYVGWADLDPLKPAWKAGGTGVDINLKPLYTVDNYQYTWFTFEGVNGSASCALCHRESAEADKDAHSQSAKNIRFITLYNGTNVHGQKCQDTTYDYTGKVLPADPSKPYYGPGFKLDNYNRAGNCATCHAPVAGKISNEKNCGWSGCHTDLTAERAKNVMDPGVSPVPQSGPGLDGVSCEFCHKVGDVTIDPKTHLPPPDMPGILSMRLYRPPGMEQIFFGTVLDVNRRVTYAPIETKSEFCAPCHYGVFGGVVGMNQVTGGTTIYNSYGEWLNSPWSDPKTGKTCQGCHMLPSDADWFVRPDKGGISRDYVTLHNHTMPGVTDEQFMKNAVTLKSSVSHDGNALQVQVSVTNDKTGHDVPSDAPIRSMMLVVEVLDANGQQLSMSSGPTLPDWTGNYAGKAGKGFAKILKDDWTGETPTAAYWRPTTIVADTRLAPYATDSSTYTFNLPSGAKASVQIKLIYRRAFQFLAEQKGWNDPDLIMAESTLQVEK